MPSPTDLLIDGTIVSGTLPHVTISATALSGDRIGILGAIDPDPDETFDFALLDDADGRFFLDGAFLRISESAVLDPGGAGEYTVTVRVTDASGLTLDRDIVIGIAPDPALSITVLPDPTAGNDTLGSAGVGRTYFLAGPGDDELTVGSSDVVVFSGARESYLVEEIDDGSGGYGGYGGYGGGTPTLRITDLRAGGPDGVDLILGDAFGFRFADGDYARGELLGETAAGLLLDGRRLDVDAFLSENLATGTVVGQLSVRNRPAGEGFTVTGIQVLAFINGGTFGANDRRDDLFEVDATGQLVVAGLIDFEFYDQISITIDYVDGAGNAGRDTISVRVDDTLDPPTSLSVFDTSGGTPVTARLVEHANRDAPVVVGTLTPVDPDGAALGYEFSLADPADAARFEISGNQLILKQGALIDHETEPVVIVTVAVRDLAAPAAVQTVELPVVLLVDFAVLSTDPAGSALTASDGFDSIRGLDGNDTIAALDGDDSIVAGGGDDVVSGGGGDDAASGEAGDDTIDGGAGNDRGSGGAGADSLTGGDGDDTLDGGAGNDTVVGGAGADLLLGGVASDALEGATVYALESAAQGSADAMLTFDTLSSVAPTFTLPVAGLTDPLTVATGGLFTTQSTDGRTFLLDGEPLVIIPTGAHVVEDAANPSPPVLAGNATAIFSGPLAVQFSAPVSGIAMTVGFLDSVGSTQMIVLGVRGEEIARWTNEGTGIEFVGFATDSPLIGGFTLFNVRDEPAGFAIDNLEIFSQAEVDALAIAGDAVAITTLGGLATSGDDLLQGNAGNDTAKGGAGNDTIFGGTENDLLLGEDGNDRLGGGAGSDTLDVGDGFDALNYFFATGGVTVDLRAEGTAQAIGGGEGTDTFFNIHNAIGSTVGADRIDGDAKFNQLFGYGGDDTLRGQGGNDTVRGGAGNDLIGGGDGNDLLFGEAGGDSIYGGGGTDTIIGGAGGDLLFGGAAADVFRLLSVSDSGFTSRDTIGDFVSGSDRLDLSAIDADTTAAGNGAFTFIGSAAFSAAGQVRFVTNGTDGWVQANVDGNLAPDLVIALLGVTGISAGDLLL